MLLLFSFFGILFSISDIRFGKRLILLRNRAAYRRKKINGIFRENSIREVGTNDDEIGRFPIRYRIVRNFICSKNEALYNFLNLCVNISVRLYLCVNRMGISGYFKRKLIELLGRIMKNSRDASDEIGRFLIGSFEINL